MQTEPPNIVDFFGDGYAFCNWLTFIAVRRFVMGKHKKMNFSRLSGLILDGIKCRYAY